MREDNPTVGLPVVSPSNMLPVQVVDASNCAAWDKPYAMRECPSWEDVMRLQT